MERHAVMGRPSAAIPPRAGVGLKPDHYRAILDKEPDVEFFEAHAKNHMGAGGPPHRHLEAIRERYPISLHGVGLSIDVHGSPVSDEVGSLYERALSRLGAMPTLTEWDNDVPAWPVLSAETGRADRYLHDGAWRSDRERCRCHNAAQTS
ncbi:DUF692 domain-containing protein [Inquilinus limosus]|uniref:multinuclear nonheme iron-dependent oxidase n=1 Tax=Inquilinus limosus TaxID=171674 RepID=UPI003F159372